MKKCCFLIGLFAVQLLNAQDVVVKASKDNSWKKIYRAEASKINDLVNTKLDVRFDYANAWMYGKEWLTLKPHFYPTDSLSLDAQGMKINEVAIITGTKKLPLKYAYDNKILKITLNKTYKGGENYTIYIDYISKPNEVKVEGSLAINDAKGLYFINPKGEEKNKPTQIWTQGETESNSVWMPTIDKPNQKSTEEISMTVPAKYVTLSNGLLISQRKNTDGTRTDTWKMDLPHAPYLFFMGVGDYAVIKDSYKGKEVSYYVEKEYAPVARKIFGNTPEMIKFYSEKLGIEFPWAKYSQIVGRDYVSGAMENTTATLHQESAYQDARQLLDGNSWEDVVSHELFHQWFGDLVTTESWSNITVNESFADFSETLWEEYKYGKDAGDEHNFSAMQDYLLSGSENKDLVRFYYRDKEDMFDDVSYQKGGRVLNMLRSYVGEDAFFKSLNKYLTDNKFKTGEAQQLRLAFESVTGQDLNWFWNQWYYSSGHPILKIDYSYDDAAGQAMVIMQQLQKGDKIFKLPIAIDIYNGADKKSYNVWMNNKTDTFSFSYTTRPDLINVDANKIILCQKTDNKTADNYLAQIKYAPLYLDRREALEYFAKNNMQEITLGLKDKFAGLRSYTLDLIGEDSALLSNESTIETIEMMAKTDSDRKTKAKALEVLATTGNAKYKPLFAQYINDSSYSIAGAALMGLNNLDGANALALAKKMAPDAKGKLDDAIAAVIMQNGTEADFDFLEDRYVNLPLSETKVSATLAFCDYLTKLSDTAKIKSGIDKVVAFRNEIPEAYRAFIDPAIKNALQNVAAAKGPEIGNYISNALK
ncbi:M1 family metallopeptidase [Panacibacter ginsenosidivorans]|uniref:Aminopeptidase N n=1 Tax=Panacibacter ginsenosidivorans TaxID=1813871 RepID=A0A5B8V6W1_9BACT|nr:M1 family metallopeptidase [Panacibacter ginsenosidivorans]QEC67042.1 M1 family metallopeptidase [Panacibacter ginsenosidivorans]